MGNCMIERLLLAIGQGVSSSGVVVERGSVMGLVSQAVLLLGVVILTVWMLSTEVGTKALVGSREREIDFPWQVPFFMLAGWLMLVVFLSRGLVLLLEPSDSGVRLVESIGGSVGTLVMIPVMVIYAGMYFRGGLAGFGLGGRRVWKDVLLAPLYLVAILPVVFALLDFTNRIGAKFGGSEFEEQQHEILTMLQNNPSKIYMVLVVFSVVFIVPIFEEMFFRGFVQSTLRKYVKWPWLAICITSVFFALMHADYTHWPALFVLGGVMGYAYEKSGSLYRGMLIHAMFNATNVIGALYS